MARPLHTRSGSRAQSKVIAGPWATLFWPAPSAFSESSPACSLQSHLEPWVSVAIRACNWKIQDDSIWENSLFTQTQAILRNHPEIHACSFFFFSSIFFLFQNHLWGAWARKRTLWSFRFLDVNRNLHLHWKGLQGQGHDMFTQEVSSYQNFLPKC